MLATGQGAAAMHDGPDPPKESGFVEAIEVKITGFMAIERDALNASRIKSDLREPHLGGPYSLQCGGTMPLQFVIELFLIRKFKSLVISDWHVRFGS